MSATGLINVEELSPAELCDYIQQDYYEGITALLNDIRCNATSFDNDENEIQGLLKLLFTSIEGETLQMIRNDELVIFPLIHNRQQKKSCGTTKLPVDLIRQMHLKITSLIEKMRQSLNDYSVRPGFDQFFFDNKNNLLRLCKQLLQVIDIKENQLLHKVKDKFNQTCSGNCKLPKH